VIDNKILKQAHDRSYHLKLSPSFVDRKILKIKFLWQITLTSYPSD